MRCCGFKKKKTKQVKRKVERFEKQLDVKSLAIVQANLAILVSLLLSEQQQLLFNNQHDRAYNQGKSRGAKKRRAKALTLSGSDSDSSGGQTKGVRSKKLRFIDSGSKEKKSKTFEKLMDYPVASELDKKLVRGMFAEEGPP